MMNKSQCLADGLNVTDDGTCVQGETLVGIWDQSAALAAGAITTGPYAYFT
jgi:hypothetical protein